MIGSKHVVAAIAGISIATAAAAQEPVAAVADAEALFRDADPKLNANKQATYHIVNDLLEAGHWDQADRWLTARYIQHNPLVGSGRAGVVDFFTNVLKVQPKPVKAKMDTRVAAVVAQGDMVVVAFPRELPDPKNPGKTYSTTWFDMWRFVDGKADEHWDGQMK